MKRKSHIEAFILMTSIILLSCNNNEKLPQIEILKSDAFSWDKKENCKIIYKDDDVSIEMPAEIKYRGGHSARYAKHSFSLELVKKYRLAGLPKDDDWILNANYIDKTFMRHKISYDLYSDMHENNMSAASDYVNLIVNGNAQGLYLITEKINGGQLEIDKQDSLAMVFKDPPFLFESRILNPQDTNNYYQQKFPKIREKNLTNYIEEFRSFLFDTSEIEFSTQVHEWIDIDNVIDWHLLLLYSYNADGIMKNFYLYKLNSKTPFRIAIWDYDHSFGRDGDNEMNMMERSMRMERSILFNRLLSSANLNYQKKLKKRWKELRDQGLFGEDYMTKKINAIDSKIAKSVQVNAKIWPWDSKWYYDANNYEDEKEVFLKFVKMRLEVLDKEFDYQNS